MAWSSISLVFAAFTSNSTVEPMVDTGVITAFIYRTELLDKHPDDNCKLKKGTMISFMAGYKNDIRMMFTIIGFDVDDTGDVLIYLDWDCYWSPIRFEERRDIHIVDFDNTAYF